MHSGLPQARRSGGRHSAVQADRDAGVGQIDADALGREVMTTYTEYPPKGYRVRVSTYWWLGRWAYLKFILREISSVFVAWFIVETLLQISALIDGPAAY